MRSPSEREKLNELILLAPIEDLDLSPRSNHSLHRAGVNIVDQLLSYDERKLKDLHGLGQTSVAEICAAIEKIRTKYGIGVEYTGREQQIIECPESFTEVKTDDLSLSVRAKNCLRIAGVDRIDISWDRDKLMKLRNLGWKTAEEILEAVRDFKETHANRPSLPLSPGKTQDANSELCKEMANKGFFSLSSGVHVFLSLQKQHQGMPREKILSLLFKQNTVRLRAKQLILQHLESTEDGISIANLLHDFPKEVKNTTILEDLLIEMESAHLIRMTDNVVHRRYPTVLEYIADEPANQPKKVFQMRLRGSTLREIGDALGVSHERVRQLYKRSIENKPRFFEDRYVPFYQKYTIAQDDFCTYFNEAESTWRYLNLVYPRRGNESLPLEACLSDEAIPLDFRKNAEKALLKNYVTIGNIRLSKNRQEFIWYYIRTYCRDLTPINEFKSGYNAMLENLGLKDDKRLQVEPRYLEILVQKFMFCLISYRHRFRYYNIDATDADAFVSEIDWSQYTDKWISTQKLFRDYPQLMAEYDLHDYYELHNYLRKTLAVSKNRQMTIEVHRMPMLKIGIADREKQVFDFMCEHAPIEQKELAALFEESYGVDETTALVGWFPSISAYCHDGVYSIPEYDLSPEQYQVAKTALTDDYYSISDVKRKFASLFATSGRSLVSTYSLKRLGFKVYAGYVLRNTHTSAAEFFSTLLNEKETVDINAFPSSMRRLLVFSAQLAKLRKERALIEYEPQKFIQRRKLEQIGVGLSDLDDFCSSVLSHVTPGSFFTIKSLQDSGYKHHLFELGFDDWFYASVLEHGELGISVRKMASTKLLFAGKKTISDADFLQWFVQNERRTEVYDLLTRLERFGVPFKRSRLLEIVKDTELYYSGITDAVYDCYDTYFEEI